MSPPVIYLLSAGFRHKLSLSAWCWVLRGLLPFAPHCITPYSSRGNEHSANPVAASLLQSSSCSHFHGPAGSKAQLKQWEILNRFLVKSYLLSLPLLMLSAKLSEQTWLWVCPKWNATWFPVSWTEKTSSLHANNVEVTEDEQEILSQMAIALIAIALSQKVLAKDGKLAKKKKQYLLTPGCKGMELFRRGAMSAASLWCSEHTLILFS